MRQTRGVQSGVTVNVPLPAHERERLSRTTILFLSREAGRIRPTIEQVRTSPERKPLDLLSVSRLWLRHGCGTCFDENFPQSTPYWAAGGRS